MSGFSKGEILIVTVVLAVILGVILPNAFSAIKESDRRECLTNILAIEAAMRLCYSDVNDATKCDSAKELESYIENAVIPICPFTKEPYQIVETKNIHSVGTVDISSHFKNMTEDGKSVHLQVK